MYWPILVAGLLAAQTAADARPQTLVEIWGTVTRCNKSYAEFNIGLKDGLWPPATLNVYRGNKFQPLCQVQILLVDPKQAVGKYQDRFAPMVGDRILFARRAVGNAPDHPLNELIGKRARVNLSANQPDREQSVWILGIETTAADGIESVSVLPASFTNSSRPTVYRSSNVRFVQCGDVSLVRDDASDFLLTLSDLNARRAERRLKEELAKVEAEKRRLREEEFAKAEAKRRREEQLARVELDRQRQEQLTREREQRLLQEEAAAKMAEQKQLEEAARKEAGRKKQEELAQAEAERKKQETPKTPPPVSSFSFGAFWENHASDIIQVSVELGFEAIRHVLSGGKAGPTSGRVHVEGYTRGDGTHVRPHTRSMPRSSSNR